MSTGSLAQGLSAAVGMALAAKVQGMDYRTYAICGDGELAEGQIWEASMAAAKYHLGNLCVFVDVNGLQIDGATKDVMPTEPLDEKFAAFNWNVLKCDGHDFAAIREALALAEGCTDKPTVILLKTVKGKGVSFMENNAGWHGKAPNDEQFAQAKAELEAQIAQLEKEVG
jgi:transketolase